MESTHVLGDQFMADWSWRPRQTRIHVGPGIRLVLDVLAGHLCLISSSKFLMILSNVPKKYNIIR